MLGLGTLALGAVNTYSQWPRKARRGPSQSARPVIIMGVLSAVVVAAVGYDIYDRRTQVQRDAILGWGAAGDNYHMTVDTHELQGLEKSHRLMLLVRPQLIGTDRITDTNIGKSGLFTISGAAVTIALPANVPLRMVPNQVNFMEYNAVLLPVGIGPERISSLRDVTDLGGKVFQSRGSSVMAGAALNAPQTKAP